MHRSIISSNVVIPYILACVCSVQVAAFVLSTPHFLNNKAMPNAACSSSSWCQWGEIVLGEDEDTEAYAFHEIDSNSGWTSPRAWLEGMQADERGVYSVLRCDYRCGDGEWKIWGLDFHLNRLQDSYSRSHRTQSSHPMEDGVIPDYKTAAPRSQRILKSLLGNIASGLLEKLRTNDNQLVTPSSLWAVTVMVTLLWQATPGHDGIAVKGHCFSAGLPVNLWETHPEAVVASLALLPEQSKAASQTSSLPNRFSFHPEAKLTSWIQRRRPLEQAFQTPNIGEALLLRQLDNESNNKEEKYEILEGLTSNVFFIYPKGKLRTAPSGVLLGYGRQMVLDAAASCEGLEVDRSPITLDDAALWQEVFLTSSIKLVVPVCQILVPTQTSSNSEEIVWKQIWSKPVNQFENEVPFWRKIREHLIRNVHSS